LELHVKYGFPEEYSHYILPIETFLEKISKKDKIILEDPPEVADLIKKYEAIIPLNITKDYIRKRKFNAFKALREIVQNSLDETEYLTGKPDVTIKVSDIGTWIIDSGRGLEGSAFIIGISEKECWMRGYYGEGLKLAVGYLVLKGYPIYIFTNRKVFKPVFLPIDFENAWLNILMGESRYDEKGTAILIKNYKLDEKTLNELISFKNPVLRDKLIDQVYLKGEDCDFEKPCTIYDYPDLLYVRNLLVGKTSEVTKRKSLFTYDVWWFRLDVSRNLLTYSMPQLFIQIAEMFEKSRKARKALARKLIETKMIKLKHKNGGLIIEFSPIFGIFEGHLFVYAFPEGLLEDIIEELKLEAKKECIRLFTEQNTEDEINDAVKKGIIPFIVNSEIADKSKIPKYEEDKYY